MQHNEPTLGRYGVLVMALAAFHILAPAVEILDLSGLVISTLHSVTPLALLWGVSANKTHRRIALLAMIPFLVVVWLQPEIDQMAGQARERLGAALAVMMAIYYGLMIGIVLQDIGHTRKADIRLIWAGVSAYMLLGMFFGMLHIAVHAVFDGAYMSNLELDRLSYYDHIYLSYTTLTTLGYGDIVPTHPVSRSLATFEAMTGTLFVTVIIARLVALELAHRTREAIALRSSSGDRSPDA